jgi:hypothetical protein
VTVTGARAPTRGRTKPLADNFGSPDSVLVRGIRENGVDAPFAEGGRATYRGRQATRLLNRAGSTPAGTPAGAQTLGVVRSSEFGDGSIEVDVVGLPREGAPPGVRGFVGVAFRVQELGVRFEAFYLRFANARSDDQVMRNHAAQYISHPDFPWQRLREEAPGRYESYVDIEPGTWNAMKVVVADTKARLYVNGANQPCLIVNDLKLGKARGQIALWSGSDSIGYFSGLKVKVEGAESQSH